MEQQEIIMQPEMGALHYWRRDIWRYRELFFFLAWRAFWCATSKQPLASPGA
jgi:hypothetical protein